MGRQTPKALKLPRNVYRDLVENSMVGMYRSNLKGDILYANAALADMLEFQTVEDLKSQGAVARYKNREDREVLLQNLKETGSVTGYEVELLTRTGKTKHVLLSAAKKGEFLTGVVIDITGQTKAEGELKLRVSRMGALHEAMRQLVTSDSLTQVLDKCATLAVDLIGATGTVIFLKEKKGRKTILVPWVAKGPYGREIMSMTLNLGEGISGKVAAGAKSRLVNRVDLTTNGKLVPGTALEPESLLSAPLMYDKKVTGVITVSRLGDRTFSQEDLLFLEDLANISSAAIENTRLFDQAREEIEERKKVETELRRLSTHLNKVREQDRIVVARELHDELGQIFTALKMDWISIRKRLSDTDKQLTGRFDKSVDTIDSGIVAIRRIAKELRPPLLEEAGLAATIEWQARDFQERFGVESSVSVDPEVDGLDPDRSITVFRVVQEALNNVARHAKASMVKLQVKRTDGFLRVEITDNGRGITEQEMGKSDAFGILGMKERVRPFGGELTVRGKKGKGTSVTAVIPV